MDELINAWRVEASRPREGWDFSEFAGRITEELLPWDFAAICRAAIAGARSVLDIGTGGGEQLLAYRDVLPPDTVATEGWPPNIPVATRALAPHGIAVLEYDAERGDPLPFPDGRFDLVIDRHEAYEAAEVARVLRPGGVFVTQQVDGNDFAEAHEIFGAPVPHPEVTLARFTADARAAGLTVTDSADWRGHTTFADVGTLVGYFTLVPWDVPDDFSVDAYRDTLLALHARPAPLAFTSRRFWLRAEKPALD